MPTDKVLNLKTFLNPDETAAFVVNSWTKYSQNMADKRAEWAELDKYIFATDTTTTTNQALDWTHTVTIPKLTNIRDNLHSNYLSSLFPNDKWLSWLAHSQDAAKADVAKTMTSYMENKTREGGFRTTVSRLLYDYIDKGVAFTMPSFEVRYKVNDDERVTDFIGPKTNRISAYDIVFDPTAAAFENTWKIIRSIKTVGEVTKMVQTHPDQAFWQTALDRRMEFENRFSGLGIDDWEKASQYQMDGFGSLFEYYDSNSIEILEFYGDFYNPETGEVETDRMITVADRTTFIRNEKINTYNGKDQIRMVGWRLRPDNLWAMGPLDNLVGMQYRLDHLENMKANAVDLAVLAPTKIIGDVEEFEYAPLAEIHIDSKDSDVATLERSLSGVFAAKDEVAELEARMELYAGAPREAMGIRTAGEKTAFEVQALQNAAGRIFQEKIIQFELFLEQVLNDMLETAHRHLDVSDVIRIIDNDIGVAQFKNITKEDITADGILRPVGARHFAQQAQELQNLTGIFASPMAQVLAPHTSGIALARFVEDVIDLKGYRIFVPNIAVDEQQNTQSIVNQAQEDNIVAEGTSEEQLNEDIQEV
ncbi:MAG: hypothetical protein KUG64_11300 [Cycloclasticus sp.]|nr:hypothetical protein [Cycloclasticus sp.]